MEVLLILFLLGVGAAGKAALDHASDAYRKSKAAAVKAATGKKGGKQLGKSRRAAVSARHAQGFWASEALHGFPMARRGWHTGWLAHKAAADHTRAQREEARTTHLETRASVLSAIPEHRKRQAEARALIEKALAEHPDATSRKAVGEAAGAVVLPFPSRTASSAGDAPPLPSETVGRPEPGPYARPTRRADGKPETDADTRFFDLRESGYDGPVNQDGRKPDMSNPQEAAEVAVLDGMRERRVNEPGADAATWSPETTPQEASPATNGNGAEPMAATDTTYTSVIQAARAALAQSDQDTASIRGRKDAAYQAADEMVAAHVDPAAVEAQMNYADALKAAEDALAAAGEHAANTASTVERFHGGMQEAVDSAPGQIAERQFHEGS